MITIQTDAGLRWQGKKKKKTH